MNTTFALTLALTTSLVAAACGKADAPSTPVAALNAPAAMAPDSAMTSPVTPVQEVPLPPLPSNITAAPEQPAPAAPTPTAQDSAATNPKGDMTPAKEQKTMPEALQGNNHSSTALDKDAPQTTTDTAKGESK